MAKDPYADLFRFVAQAESGGRDYDSAGRVITSPKGAKGSMQVMDATNLDPGYGVRPAKDDSLEERARVGQDYLKAMIANYGGDLTKGLAAYNAGPGNVDRALAMAQKSGDPNWMQYLPKPQETVPYVQKIVGNMMGEPSALDRIASAVMPSARASTVNPKLEADPLYQMLTGAQSSGATPSDKLSSDPVWQMLNAPAQSKTTESRSPDGALRVEMGGTSGAAPTPQPGVLGSLAEGVAQGFGDVPVGIGQAGMHQGQQILRGVDELLGTNLASRVAPNVAARDAEVAQREAQYQAATPGSVAAGIGRVGGNIAFSLAGGPAATAAPMMTGAQAGARALPMAPGVGRVLGAGVGSGLQGAGYGAVAPVAAGDYDRQSLANTQAGALLGAVAPGVGQLLGAGGRYVGNNIRAAIAPFTESGRESVAQNIIAQAARGGPLGNNAAQMVPGSAPTLAEISGNPGIANLQRTIRDLNPTPFVEREEANALARARLFEDMAGDASKLDFFRADRAAVANNYYGKAIADYDGSQLTPWLKGEITKLLKRPSIDKASRTAQRWAIERGEKPAPEGSLRALHDVKTAVDDMISESVRAGKGGEAKALQATKDKLLTVMEKLSPEYAVARTTYEAMSKPVNQMEVLQGLNLTDQMGNITLQKVQSAISGIQKRLSRPGTDAAKSLEPHQLATLEAIRDDLLRSKAVQAGRSAGSNTAQNLATQNMLQQMLPGRLGALLGATQPGMLSGALGGGVGFLAGGPAGAATGYLLGSGAGRALNSAMRTQNEAIQGVLARMLLNQGGSGLSALQGAARVSGPAAEIGGLQRLLYPALTAGGALGLGRIPMNNGNSMQPIPNAF